MLREAENSVTIVGTLLEKNLKAETYKDKKTGKDVECIRGDITVAVDQKINGEMVALEIPVNFFAKKYTQQNEVSKLYKQYEEVMKNFVSAAASSRADADRVSISGSVDINEYPNKGKISSSMRVSGRFISKARANTESCAKFSLEFVFAECVEVVDRDGVPVEPAKLSVKAIAPKYNDGINKVTLTAMSPAAISNIKTYWEPNKTYVVNGVLNFSSKTETTIVEQDFGDPIEKSRTVNVRELLITGGSAGVEEYDIEEVSAAVKAHNAKLQQRLQEESAQQKAPSKSSLTSEDLGF